MRCLLDAIADGKSMSQATALAYGTRSKIAWVHVRNSKKEKEQDLPPDQCRYWVYDWPEESEGHHLCDAYQMAIQIARLDFHAEVLAEIRQGTRPVLEGGAVQYVKSPKLLAEWKNAEDALVFGGIEDWPYEHDENGARIELRVRDRTSAALTIAALKTEIEKWNVEQRVNVTKRVSNDVVLVLGERREREQQKPENKFERADIEELRRLAKLPPKNPHPTGKVDLGNGGRGMNDPPERINNQAGDDASRPLTPALPPPQPQQPVVSYARRRTNALDAVDRATGDGSSTGMPSGGFAMNQRDGRGRPKPT